MVEESNAINLLKGLQMQLVTITLDKERHLRLTLKGMIEFEKITGKNLLKAFNFKELTLEELSALAWACLLHEDRELKYDDVLYMVDIANMTEVIEAVTKCLEVSLSKVQGDKADKNHLTEELKSQPG